MGFRANVDFSQWSLSSEGIPRPRQGRGNLARRWCPSCICKNKYNEFSSRRAAKDHWREKIDLSEKPQKRIFIE